ncbi:MAG: STAS domain-containing protein [Gammaproteobacteria bacterium]|nr:STAS domain-containing protein [Gammaproteobacteria bacterium]
MTAKKPALDYDPLAWLNDEEDSPQSEKKKLANKSKAKTSTKTKTKAVKKAKKASVKEEATPVVATEGSDFGFFDNEIASPESEMENQDLKYDLLSMGSELTIKNVAMFKEKIDASLANQMDIKLDPADLQKIDACGLQLLYSLHANLSNTGQKIHWASKNPVINSAASILGLTELLQSSTVTTGVESTVDSQSEGFGFF